MKRKIRLAFLILILTQAAHSIEEYRTRLYEVLAPARFISSLFSDDPAAGFLTANALLVAFGLFCWGLPVRLNWRGARGLTWFWTLLELANGAGHLFFALNRGGYFPGAATAPLLLVLGTWLAFLLTRES